MKKIFFLILSIFYIFSTSFSNNVDLLTERLYWIFSDKNNENFKTLNKHNIVKSFCDNVSINSIYDWWFSVNKSLFLKILCNNTWINTNYSTSYDFLLKKDSLDVYKSLSDNSKKNSNNWIFGKCKVDVWYITSTDSLNNVNFVCVADSIFNELANDYLNIATYFAYWGFKNDKWLKQFESDFFLWDICNNSYLMSDNDNEKYCKHKEAYTYFKNLISWLNNWIKNLYFIDVSPENIYTKIKKTEIKDANWNNIKSTQSTKYFLTIKDMLYTELYFYSIFLEFYASTIELESSWLQLKTDSFESVKNMERISQEEANRARESVNLAKFSVSKSFTVLKDVYWTLPLHIGYMAIKEDIKKLMSALATIYTPIDQLRYKLKNVQDKDKK